MRLLLFSAAVLAFVNPAVAQPPSDDYSKAETLDDAIDILKKTLEGTPQYAGLIYEDAVKAALKISIRGVNRDLANALSKSTNEKEKEAVRHHIKHFRDKVEPLLATIIKSGKWPQGSSFVVNVGQAMPGFTLQLHVPASRELAKGIKTTGYAVQVLEVKYGFAGPAEDAVLRLQ